MRVTIETSNPAVITKVMSICVENSTKASPVWVMGEPDAAPPSKPKTNGTAKHGRKQHTCAHCGRGFLGNSVARFCSKTCTGKHYYQTVIKPGIESQNKLHAKRTAAVASALQDKPSKAK